MYDVVVFQAYAALQQHALKSIERLGLGYSDFGVLEVLLHKGPTPVNTIGEKVNLTSGSISVAVDRLEKRGLVERRTDATDRRARVVHLTAAGRKQLAAERSRWAQLSTAIAGVLNRPGESEA